MQPVDIAALQRITFQQAMNTAAMVEAMGMDAENKQRLANGESIAYDRAAFCDLLDRYGVTQNTHHYLVVG